MLTPKGFFVRVRVLWISLRRSSGVGWVRAVSYKTWISTIERDVEAFAN